MKSIPLLLAIFVVCTLWRVGAVFDFTLSNFAPVTALAFCSGAFLRDGRGWLAAAALLVVPDLWINHHYAVAHGYTWDIAGMALRLAALGVSIAIGLAVARKRTLVTLFAGTVASSLIFYLVTNTAAWWADPGYAHTAGGWWQALTVGHPEFPPSLLFLRNALIGDLVCTSACAALAAPLRVVPQTKAASSAGVSS